MKNGKRKVLLASITLVFAILVISVAVFFFGGRKITVAPCIVTDTGVLYMVYEDRPVQLNYGKPTDYRTGDKLLILHSSEFAESYPEQVKTRFIIRVGSGAEGEIPQRAFEVLDSLEGLGNPR